MCSVFHSDKIKAAYIEITDFLSTMGGAYAALDVDTCRDLVDVIMLGQYRVARDEAGAIVAVSTWWMIHEADLDQVRNGRNNGRRPGDITAGSIVYVADHAGKCGIPDLIRFIRRVIGKKGVCWHHRYKQPGQFRYYPNKEGINV